MRTIARWWTDDLFGTELDDNIGIATGNGIVVLDVDVKNGKEGLKSFAMLDLIYGLDPTLTARTPSGGYHLFFRCGSAIGNTVENIAPGIDVRGDRGYVVGVGSTIDGVAYEWVDGIPK